MLTRVDGPAAASFTSNRESPVFDSKRLRRLGELEGHHFWFAGRRRLVERLLDRHLGHRVDAALDVGCGTGAFLSTLEQYAGRVVGLDPLATDDRMVNGRAEQLPFASASFDLVVLLDVLEHVDDRAAVAEIARVLRPGGWAVLTVPALPRLWSRRDVLAGHLRRYGRKDLTKLLESSGFVVAETAYYQFFLFPIVVASRLLARVRPEVTRREEDVSPQLNRLFRGLADLEVTLGRSIPWPWGSTIAVAAQKAAA